MAESVDMILPLLREMRKENEERHDQSLGKFDTVQRRLDKIDETLGSFERKVRELESQK